MNVRIKKVPGFQSSKVRGFSTLELWNLGTLEPIFLMCMRLIVVIVMAIFYCCANVGRRQH